MTRFWLALYFVTVAASSFGQTPLLPAALPELPSNIRTDLERRKCKIPQLTYLPGFQKRENVIRGEFAMYGQTDWAVLCEVGGSSSILIYWNASHINPTKFGEERIEAHYELTQDGALGGNIRAIATAGKQLMIASYRRYGGPKPPMIDHDGIEDGLAGKSSSISYFHNGKWIGWTSSD